MQGITITLRSGKTLAVYLKPEQLTGALNAYAAWLSGTYLGAPLFDHTDIHGARTMVAFTNIDAIQQSSH